jgi:hypothetical protein
MIANAGAPHPILVREGQIQEIKIDGTPLGMFPGIEYETVTLALQPGDVLIIASDGIQVSMNENGQPLRVQPPQRAASQILPWQLGRKYLHGDSGSHGRVQPPPGRGT